MFITFRMGLAASGKIDTVFFGVSKSPVKNWEVIAQRTYTDSNTNRKNKLLIFFEAPGLPNFLTRDLL